MLAAFATTILFSFSALFAQRTAKVLGGISANFWRMLLATFCLGVWSHSFGIGWTGPVRGWLFLSGLIGFGIGDVAMFQALPRLGSRLCILIVHCLATPVAAVAEYFWMGSTLSAYQILCIAASLSGVAIALAPDRRNDNAPRGKDFSLGLFFGMLAMLGQAFGAVVSRKANLEAAAESFALSGIDMAYQRSLGGILVATIVYAVHRLSSPGAKAGPGTGGEGRWKVWAWVGLNTMAGPVMGVSCYQYALAAAPTGVVLPIVALTPLVIIPFAHWMENERTTIREILGGMIAVAGVAGLAHLTAATR